MLLVLASLAALQFIDRISIDLSAVLTVNLLLQVLDLSYNKITAIEGLENLPIQELNLSHNSITSLEGLSNLPNLTSLNVSDNNIVSFFPLASCSQLSYLDSSKNRITHIRQVEFLKDIPWLKVLLLTDNPCYRKVFYRYILVSISVVYDFLPDDVDRLRVIFRLPKLERLDHVNVSNNERVRTVKYIHLSVSNRMSTMRVVSQSITEFQVMIVYCYTSIGGV